MSSNSKQIHEISSKGAKFTKFPSFLLLKSDTDNQTLNQSESSSNFLNLGLKLVLPKLRKAVKNDVINAF